jgi:hypothetical protein
VTSLPQELRQLVVERAQRRCEYCLLPEREALHPHQIDHVIPRQHGGADTEDNLALCCVVCNRYKGPNLATLDPETEELTGFFNPRRHTWDVHFRLDEGRVFGLSPEGRATAFIFRFNDEVHIIQRITLLRQGRYLKQDQHR